MATPSAPPSLVADCTSCFALCCVLLPFAASSGFGIDKPGGTPCPHLAGDDRCRIHATLREDGWSGCATFDCFGAGQQVSQVTYGGVSWRDHHNLGEMAAVLSVMRPLHEMLWHLAEVARRSPDPVAAELEAELVGLTGATPDELLGVDLDALQDRAGAVLESASRRLRSGPSYRRRDLAGHDLRDQPLSDADLRGALLIGADLRGMDLGRADLLGADLRDADVRGADLGAVLFLGQAQVNAARGDALTRIPQRLGRPSHWS
ncbi:MAG: pentapeptide repeat-containing protein [Nocardioides sp.]